MMSTDANVILTIVEKNAKLWIIHVANTIAEVHQTEDANLMVAVLHSVFAPTDGPDQTAKPTLTNVLMVPMIVQPTLHAITPTEDTNAHVVPVMKATEKKVEMDVKILTNVSSKVTTVVLNPSASTTMAVSHANVNQDLLAIHPPSDVPNQKHHADVLDSPVISTLQI
jgi:hypothetical protein